MTGLYRRLFSILGEERKWRFIGVGVFSIISAALQLVGVGAVFPMMALLSNPDAMTENPWVAQVCEAVGVESYDTFLLYSGIFMVVAILVANLSNIATTWLTQYYIADEQVRLADMLLQKYAYKPYEFFLVNDSTALCRDVLNEVTMFLTQFVKPLLDIIVRAVAIAAIGGGLLLINPPAAVGAVAVFGGGYLVVYLACRESLRKMAEVRIESEVLKFKITSELFRGQREARLLNCRENFFSAFSENASRQQGAILHASLISQLPRQFIEVLGFALVVLLVMLFRYQGMPWTDVLPLLSLYAVGAIRMMPQFQSLFASVAALQSAAPILERLEPEFEGGFPKRVGSDSPLEWQDKIEFKELCYTYPQTDTLVLNHLCCEIKKGEHVGFVGTTGAGKTTLINIILGLLQPTGGGIYVDGRPIGDEELLSWQANLGFVPQDIFLCNDTVAQNIAFGIPSEKIDLERVREAARLAALAEHIEALPDRYETRIGERGIRLSGGQRQRLGIARALYRRPEILVLDEATSALDGRTEDDVMKAMQEVGTGRTLIMIAHRLTTLKDCHRIFMLEHGSIVDVGTYDELLTRNKTFRSFAKAD